ncbi:hypothetical protein PAHAL_9G462400 [Panicum hallii]|jgi:hypothetical protein|uniref:Uncharacterized protein n=1 Tax=Panicum hallii TaxID=206008 RepID=A0A2S3IQK5_9POAL|nr:hypothetical protein PAHAL_9G462400 [Panicum hallii]
MAKAPPVLPPTSAAAAVAVMCVVVVWLAAAAPVSGAMGNPVMGALPLLVAARGSGRVEDLEPPEMDSEAHRSVVLALQAEGQSSASKVVLDAKRTWCELSRCSGRPGYPYVADPRGCEKIHLCRSGP